MKVRFLLTALLASTLFLASCTKEADQVSTSAETTYPIEGLWLGTYSVTNLPAQGSLFYSFVIYPDGTILTKSTGADGKTYVSTGTWSFQSSGSNIFVANITTINYTGLPVSQRITATWSRTGVLTDGTWMDINNPNGANFSGKFSTMQRVN